MKAWLVIWLPYIYMGVMMSLATLVLIASFVGDYLRFLRGKNDKIHYNS
jgi:hypothetical protein